MLNCLYPQILMSDLEESSKQNRGTKMKDLGGLNWKLNEQLFSFKYSNPLGYFIVEANNLMDMNEKINTKNHGSLF